MAVILTDAFGLLFGPILKSTLSAIMNLYLSAAAAILMALSIACSPAPQGASQSSEDLTTNTPLGQASVVDDESAKNILQVAQSSPDHTTLAAAIKAAGIEHVLVNAGPFTVFAPNNQAFENLPDGVLDDLLKPENKATLANIITYHASPGTYKGALLSDGRQIFQATGDNVSIKVADGVTTVNGAKILGTVEASNGVIHVIDAVLLPPES